MHILTVYESLVFGMRCAAGIDLVVCSQCLRGAVDLSSYATGLELKKLGLIDGHDMTLEACVTKLGCACVARRCSVSWALFLVLHTASPPRVCFLIESFPLPPPGT